MEGLSIITIFCCLVILPSVAEVKANLSGPILNDLPKIQQRTKKDQVTDVSGQIPNNSPQILKRDDLPGSKLDDLRETDSLKIQQRYKRYEDKTKRSTDECHYVERLAAMETMLRIYEEDRNQLFRYIDRLTEMFTRLTKLESDTDSVQTSLMEVKELIKSVNDEVTTDKGDIQSMKTEIDQIKSDMHDIQNYLPEIRNVTRSLQINFAEAEGKARNRDTSLESVRKETQNLNRSIIELSNDTQILQTSMLEVRSDTKSLLTYNDEVRTEAQRLQNSIETVRSETQNQQTRIEEGRRAVRDLQSDTLQFITNQNNLIDDLKQRFTQFVTNTGQRLSNFGRDLGNLKTKVGFTVSLGSTKHTKGTIKFDRVITNIGNGYSTSTGIFTCKTSGMYMFYLTIGSSTRDAGAWIMKNGKLVSWAYTSDDDDNDAWDSGSVSVVLMLKVGDEVLAKSRGNNIYYHGYYTSFSGVLL